MRTTRTLALALLALSAIWVGSAQAASPVLRELETAIADVVDATKPSVVGIETQVQVTAPSLPEGFNIPGFPPIPGPGNQGEPQTRPAAGSGLIFRETNDSYLILTNAHVVREATGGSVKAKLQGAKDLRDATVLGTDRLTDTAVISIPRQAGDTVKPLAMGTAANLRVGSFVIAIGSPFHFEGSVTMGIVSSLDRELEEPLGGGSAPQVRARYSGLIQTDASINPGNSGGPLLNLDGEVVGINFAIYSPASSGTNVGIGFAIPIEKALAVVDQLIEHGRVSRGFLGVSMVDAAYFVQEEEMTLDQVRELFGTDEGAFVKELTYNGPAEQAGLQANDVIVAIDGTKITSTLDLQQQIQGLRPGATVQIDILRDTKPLRVSAVLGELSATDTGDAPQPRADRPTTRPGGFDALGLRVVRATADELTASRRAQAVKIAEVEPGGLAAAKGLRPETLISEVRRGDSTDRLRIASPDDWLRVVADAERDKSILMLWVSVPRAEGGYTNATVLVDLSGAE